MYYFLLKESVGKSEVSSFGKLTAKEWKSGKLVFMSKTHHDFRELVWGLQTWCYDDYAWKNREWQALNYLVVYSDEDPTFFLLANGANVVFGIKVETERFLADNQVRLLYEINRCVKYNGSDRVEVGGLKELGEQLLASVDVCVKASTVCYKTDEDKTNPNWRSGFLSWS